MTSLDQTKESVCTFAEIPPYKVQEMTVEELRKVIVQDAKDLYRPLVIVGPSGAGKGTLISHFTKAHPDLYRFSVSYTTRQPREGEVHGKDYYFVTKDEFTKMVSEDAFIEYCEVHTNMYGTVKQQITDTMASKHIPLLDIDVHGALKFIKAFPQANLVSVLPPNLEQLEARLRGRGTESEEKIKVRITNATGECEIMTTQKDTFRFKIVNDDLALAQDCLLKLTDVLYSEELKA